jgi:hypothetical protein
MRLRVLLTAVVLVSGSPLFAQSLADVARQEGERRQTAKGGTGKTFTNKDLKAVPMPPQAPDSGAPAAGAADPPAGATAKPAAPDAAADARPADAAKPAPEKKEEVRDQAYWSKRMNGMRAQLERDQTYAAALETRINSLNMDFVNRDDPAQRDQIANDRLKAISELERLKKNIEQDKRDIVDLEEEARKAGVPPGWLR